MEFLRKFGPGFIVTAAFIGPGTVTTASQAGASFGFALLWTVVFAILATILLQEMAARLGLIGNMGLGEAIRKTFTQPVLHWGAVALVALGIGFGNAAYQTGNLTGASFGLASLLGLSREWCVVLIGVAAGALLFTGRYKVIELALIILVVLMSLVFVLTAIMVRPSLSEMAQGFVPSVSSESLLTVIALIGTTVVPYNLFLHADSVRKKWKDRPAEEALRESRRDTAISITIGGMITGAIVVTGAMAFYSVAGSAANPGGKMDLKKISDQLAPLLGGEIATYAFALGFLAAGLTSAITAPLAAAFAVTGVMGWKADLKSWSFRITWMVILVTGMAFALLLDGSPADTIILAQVANGFLLPIIALFLLIVVNRSDLMGKHRNGWVSNVLGGVVVLVAGGLGIWKIITGVQTWLAAFLNAGG
jgi:manganese transport protein